MTSRTGRVIGSKVKVQRSTYDGREYIVTSFLIDSSIIVAALHLAFFSQLRSETWCEPEGSQVSMPSCTGDVEIHPDSPNNPGKATTKTTLR